LFFHSFDCVFSRQFICFFFILILPLRSKQKFLPLHSIIPLQHQKPCSRPKLPRSSVSIIPNLHCIDLSEPDIKRCLTEIAKEMQPIAPQIHAAPPIDPMLNFMKS
jgi:hypothetical protein